MTGLQGVGLLATTHPTGGPLRHQALLLHGHGAAVVSNHTPHRGRAFTASHITFRLIYLHLTVFNDLSLS